jgi:hypothetical protein
MYWPDERRPAFSRITLLHGVTRLILGYVTTLFRHRPANITLADCALCGVYVTGRSLEADLHALNINHTVSRTNR